VRPTASDPAGCVLGDLEGRLVEVEAYVDHDAVMDSRQRLEMGMGLLAHTHNLLRQVQVGQEGRRPRLANHLEPADVALSVPRGVERIQGWDPTPAERRLVAVAEELAGLVGRAEAGLVARLPRQLVHGDFWDNNNVLFRHGRPVLVCDFDFMGERAALPLAMARHPLSSIGGWVARLDDQAAARRHAASVAPELVAAWQLMAELGRWQDAFA
jgi:hypothetical protein